METEELLLWHGHKYTQMTPQDALKLLYQKNYGAEHFSPSRDLIISRLRQEISLVKKQSGELEPVGNFLVRYPLNNLAKNEISIDSLVDAFLYTSSVSKANEKGMQEDIKVLTTLAENNELPFSAVDLKRELEFYGVPHWHAVSHSDVYRETYHPSYRLLDIRVLRLLKVIDVIHHKCLSKKNVVVVIDGPCASGKTTSAEILSSVFNAPVIHMDDFFLPFSLRSEERKNEVGGNVHYERFMEEVLPFLKTNDSFTYHRFSCSTGEFDSQLIQIPSAAVRIVEGSYSMHERFGVYGDVTCFSFVSSEEQRRRISQRGDSLDEFVSKWIPMEETYFKRQEIKERANLILGEWLGE